MKGPAEIPHRDGEGDRAKRGGGGYPSLRRPEVYAARKLRRSMSLPETLLWNELRASKIGAKFRRQHPLGPYVADFYCSSSRLVVEVDGEGHNHGDRPERDARRDGWMKSEGYKVIRFSARDVLDNIEGVLIAISQRLTPPSTASRFPSPLTGRNAV